MATLGDVLEARVQRLFLAQGIFAERALFPAAGAGHRLLATDIDVLVSEYSSGFHLTRRHAECKSGKNVKVLDRVLWLSGVRAMLGADASYLVLESFEEDAADFAKSLSVDVLKIKQLETLEAAFKIPGDRWPNRSDFGLFDPLKKRSLALAKRKGSSERSRLVREAIQFAEIDSWRVFGYGRLNRLLRILKSLSDVSGELARDDERGFSSRYAASTLLVRLGQYLLAVCHDISRVPVSDAHSYLLSRLTFGDQDPERSRDLVRNTVEWMSQALRQRGMAVPPEVDSSRLFQPPTYSEGLIGLAEKIVHAPHEARYLPVALETEQFGKDGDLERFPRLRAAWNSGSGLSALVKGFAVASLGVGTSLLTPCVEDLLAHGAKVKSSQKKGHDSAAGQAKLSFEGSETC